MAGRGDDVTTGGLKVNGEEESRVVTLIATNDVVVCVVEGDKDTSEDVSGSDCETRDVTTTADNPDIVSVDVCTSGSKLLEVENKLEEDGTDSRIIDEVGNAVDVNTDRLKIDDVEKSTGGEKSIDVAILIMNSEVTTAKIGVITGCMTDGSGDNNVAVSVEMPRGRGVLLVLRSEDSTAKMVGTKTDEVEGRNNDDVENSNVDNGKVEREEVEKCRGGKKSVDVAVPVSKSDVTTTVVEDITGCMADGNVITGPVDISSDIGMLLAES